MTPRFSVIVPTFNGEATLPALLESIWAQKTRGAVEIVAVDSGSTDSTLDILSGKGASVVNVPTREFNHGTTRNLAMSKARADLVVVTVQDAVLVGEDFLERLAAPLFKDTRLAGTFARQRARPDASALSRFYMDRWLASSETPRHVELRGGQADLDGLSPLERLDRCTFDHVAACVRRAIWERHPYETTAIAEDLEWARDVLVAGFALAFVPEAVVLHSHERSAWYEYSRTRLLHARLHDLFGVETIPTAAGLAQATLGSMARHFAVEWRHPVRWPRAAALAFAWPLGQYLGARDARAGRGRPRGRPGRV